MGGGHQEVITIGLKETGTEVTLRHVACTTLPSNRERETGGSYSSEGLGTR